jgi:hypothetical protein
MDQAFVYQKLMSKYPLPKAFREASFPLGATPEDCPPKKAHHEMIRIGLHGLYLCGSAGVGKTYAAASFANRVKTFVFLNVPRVMDDLSAYPRKDGEPVLLDYLYRFNGLVIIDDLLSSWVTSDREKRAIYCLIDDLISGLRQQCGIYSTNGYAFITGVDTQTRMTQLLRNHKLFTQEHFQTNGSSGLRQIEGQGFGFNLNAYQQIPIIPSRHLTDALQPTLGLTPLFLVYLPDITIWVDLPTTYTERGFTQGEDILMNAHKVTGLYHTMWDMHAYSFFKHAKLRDISE